MSTDTAPAVATDSPVAPPAPPDPGNPAVLGVPCAVIGVAALGLFLVGFAPTGSAGAVVPLFLALGVGLFLACRWAISAGAGPLGGIFGVFAGICAILAALSGAWVFYGTMNAGTGGQELPMGRPVLT